MFCFHSVVPFYQLFYFKSSRSNSTCNLLGLHNSHLSMIVSFYFEIVDVYRFVFYVDCDKVSVMAAVLIKVY